jgi:hypothetical protein
MMFRLFYLLREHVFDKVRWVSHGIVVQFRFEKIILRFRFTGTEIVLLAEEE